MPVEKNAQFDPMALEIPAPFVNKFQVLVAGGNVRVAFAEGFSGQPNNYRSAVAMSVSDARDLALAIIESLPAQRNALADILRNRTGISGALNTIAGSSAAEDLGLINKPDPKGRGNV